MRLNKKHLTCFFLIMLITLLCCCVVSAADDVGSNAAATTNNEVKNVQTVEQSITNNINEAEVSMGDTVQSDQNNIEETADQNDVEDENNNAKAINKTKISDREVKAATTIPTGGTVDLTGNVIVTSPITLTDDLIINGNDYTISANGLNNLFNANGHTLTINDVTITGCTGYVVSGGNNHVFRSVIFRNNGGVFYSPNTHESITLINCLVDGCTSTAFDFQKSNAGITIYNSIFTNNVNPILYSKAQLNFNGYNFIVNDEIMTNTNYLTHLDSNNQPHTGSAPVYFQATAQVHGDVSTRTSDTTIVITAPDVYINQTNQFSKTNQFK